MDKLGKYEILSELGRGSFGTVYRARDTMLDIEVALKVLKPVWMDEPRAVEMFYREARAAARLEHPNIVPIREMGEIEGRLYIAMRLIDGESLGARIKRGAMTLDEALPIVNQISSALDYAHARGLVHRDIKPNNILIGKDGVASLTDFGLVRGAEQASIASSASVGGAVGTPEYVAPEVWKGKPATSASDVYAFGCVVYEMLTSTVLFGGSSGPEVMFKHFEPRSLDEIPDMAVRATLASALDTDPLARTNVLAFAEALRKNSSRDVVPPVVIGPPVASNPITVDHGPQAVDDTEAAAAPGRISAERETVSRTITNERERALKVEGLRTQLASMERQNRFDQAQRVIEELLALQPGDEATIAAMASVAAAQQRFVEEQAAKAREAQIARDRGIADLRRSLDNALATSKWQEAEWAARQLLSQAPGDPAAKDALESVKQLAQQPKKSSPIVAVLALLLIGACIFFGMIGIVGPRAAATPTPAARPTAAPPVPSPTATAAPISPAITSLIGTWTNVDAQTRGWHKIDVIQRDDSLTFQFWGTCHPTDCDAGTVTAKYKGLPLTLFADRSFVEFTFTIQLEGDRLVLVTYQHYKDDSGRSDGSFSNEFRR
jgi:serine/threonine protein kinase